MLIDYSEPSSYIKMMGSRHKNFVFRKKVRDITHLMGSHKRLERACQAYFHMTLPEGAQVYSENPPTPEGLALAIGFPSFRIMRNGVQKLLDQGADKYLLPAQTIITACSHMQDYYLKHTLVANLPIQVIKFISSAYFDINETAKSEAVTNLNHNKTITIRVETIQPTDIVEAIEIEDLNRHLQLQTESEMAQLGYLNKHTDNHTDNQPSDLESIL